MTYAQLIAKHQSGGAIYFAIIGNSIGAGRAANYYNLLTYKPAGAGYLKLTDTARVDTRINSWPQQLLAYLRAINPAAKMVNESGASWDTNDHVGVSDLGQPPENTVTILASLSPKPDVAFIPLQVNDWGRGIALNTFQANTETIIDGLTAAGILPVIVLENAVWSTGLSAYITRATTIAANKGVPLIDTFTPFDTARAAAPGATYNVQLSNTGLMDNAESPNPVHPSQAGHDLIFAQYRQFFEVMNAAGRKQCFSHPCQTVAFSRAPLRPDRSLAIIQPREASAAGVPLLQGKLAKDDLFNLQLRLTATEMEAFKLFWKKTVRGSALAFIYADTVGTTCTVRFHGAAPDFSEKAYDRFTPIVTLRVQ